MTSTIVYWLHPPVSFVNDPTKLFQRSIRVITLTWGRGNLNLQHVFKVLINYMYITKNNMLLLSFPLFLLAHNFFKVVIVTTFFVNTVNLPVSDQTKCRDWVVSYGRWWSLDHIGSKFCLISIIMVSPDTCPIYYMASFASGQDEPNRAL